MTYLPKDEGVIGRGVVVALALVTGYGLIRLIIRFPISLPLIEIGGVLLLAALQLFAKLFVKAHRLRTNRLTAIADALAFENEHEEIVVRDAMVGNLVFDIENPLTTGKVQQVERDVTVPDGELCAYVQWADNREDWSRLKRLAVVRYG